MLNSTINQSFFIAYRIKVDEEIPSNLTQGWKVFSCEIEEVYFISNQLKSITQGDVHQFWVRDECEDFSLKINRKYLIIGNSAVVRENKKWV